MVIRTTTAVGIMVILLVTSGAGLALATANSSNPEQTENLTESTAVSAHGDNVSIQVSASGELSAAPDKAVLRLAVVSTADSADAARSQVADDVASMRAALSEMGVDDQVRTAYFDINPMHEETNNGTEIVGYRAAHGFEIHVDVETDELGNRTGAIIDTAVQNGANQIDGVQFTLTEETQRDLREQALAEAMDNARQDADFLASSSGLTITGIRAISTGDGGMQPFELTLRESAADGGATVLEPGPVTVSATVSVTYLAMDSSSSDATEVTGANVTVDQGETSTVTITASTVSRLQITAPSTEAIELLGFNAATIEPAPDRVLESLPPIWEWDSPADEVSVTLPVTVPDDIEPGTYRFTISATGSSTDETAEAVLVVEVTESG